MFIPFAECIQSTQSVKNKNCFTAPCMKSTLSFQKHLVIPTSLDYFHIAIYFTAHSFPQSKVLSKSALSISETIEERRETCAKRDLFVQ